VSYNKANGLIAQFEELGVLVQTTEGRRNRRFVYREYVNILSEGTEMIGQEQADTAL